MTLGFPGILCTGAVFFLLIYPACALLNSVELFNRGEIPKDSEVYLVKPFFVFCFSGAYFTGTSPLINSLFYCVSFRVPACLLIYLFWSSYVTEHCLASRTPLLFLVQSTGGTAHCCRSFWLCDSHWA